jgi:hypothetical protein
MATKAKFLFMGNFLRYRSQRLALVNFLLVNLSLIVFRRVHERLFISITIYIEMAIASTREVVGRFAPHP